jgi:hypothetical protein
MTKAPSPLLGYNNNVRHKNRVFHIQTEDSGIKHPHVITHLFMDGGRILKSVKTSYADHVANKDKLGDIVRQMMKDQHKAMFRALRDGEFDPIVETAIAGRKSDTAIVVPKVITRSLAPAEDNAPPATVRDTAEPPPSLTLDLDALADQSGAFKPPPDLPPPPANVLAAPEVGTGRYRNAPEREDRPPVSSRARVKSERPPRSEKVRSERPPSKGRPTPGAGAVREERVKRRDPRADPPSEPKQPIATQSSRPGPARPAALFGQAKPQQSSIFGEDIISDKSLDEVILSYLAEDLEEGSSK